MKKGFTLIELIVVIAIIAVLAAIVAPNAFKAIEKGKISATIGDQKSIKTATMALYADTSTWPTATAPAGSGNVPVGLIVTNSAGGWDGPYLDTWPGQSAFGTDVNFLNDNTIDWAGTAAGDSACYLTIESVPRASAQSLEQKIDGSGGDGTAGNVQYPAGVTPDVSILLVLQ